MTRVLVTILSSLVGPTFSSPRRIPGQDSRIGFQGRIPWWDARWPMEEISGEPSDGSGVKAPVGIETLVFLEEKLISGALWKWRLFQNLRILESRSASTWS